MNLKTVLSILSMVTLMATAFSAAGTTSNSYPAKTALQSEQTVGEPILTITIKTGPGIEINVKNTGTANATNVNVTISFQGGLILLGRYTSAHYPTLGVNQTVSAKPTFILGFGRTIITATATCDEGANAEEKVTGIVFLIFVLGVP